MTFLVVLCVTSTTLAQDLPLAPGEGFRLSGSSCALSIGSLWRKLRGKGREPGNFRVISSVSPSQGTALVGKRVRVVTLYNDDEVRPPVVRTIKASVTWRNAWSTNPNDPGLPSRPFFGDWYPVEHNPPLLLTWTTKEAERVGAPMWLLDGNNRRYFAYRHSTSVDVTATVTEVLPDGGLRLKMKNGETTVISPSPGMMLAVSDAP